MKLPNSKELLIYRGFVLELCPVFEHKEYGFIQKISLQQFKEENLDVDIQRPIDVLLLDRHFDLVEIGDKVQVTGIRSVYKPEKIEDNIHVILAQDLQILNDEEYDNIDEKEITQIVKIARTPFIQKKLFDRIFRDVIIDDNIKLIGTLILFCADSPELVERYHCNVSLLIVGPSETYKTVYLQTFKKLLPNHTFQYFQKSVEKFITYNSRYKIRGRFCKKAGLSDFAKNGIILIDNLEELTDYRLLQLDKNFIPILKKSSIISAAHTKYNQYREKSSVYNNLQFSRKNYLLKKFDIVLISYKSIDYDIKIIEKELVISDDLLRKYIFYAKKKFNPLLTQKASERIIKFKEDMIRLNKEKKIYRKIEVGNLIRVLIMLSKAYARIALRNEIFVGDVKEIIKICRKSLKNLDLI